jgi:hypothetical protein
MSKRKTTHGRRKHTARIYYGVNPSSGEALFWTVRVTDARQPVTLSGSVLDALKGQRGSVIGCHLSNCAMRNANQFPHPCKFAAFTKATALVVTKIAGGKPTEAIRYRHAYGRLVDVNDTKLTKAYVTKHPELAERQFTLRQPQNGAAYVPHPQKHREGDGSKSAKIPRGALARAVKAGLVSPGLVGAFS